MKKIFLILCLSLFTFALNARTYKVEIESVTEYQYIDNNTGEVVGQGIENASHHSYTVDAVTQDMARNKGYEQCSRACDSNWTVESYDVDYNGHNCRKRVRQIPSRSSAKAYEK